jgi:hypothetical protein
MKIKRREEANSGTNVETVDYFCVIQNSPQKQSLHRVKTKQKKAYMQLLPHKLEKERGECLHFNLS